MLPACLAEFIMMVPPSRVSAHGGRDGQHFGFVWQTECVLRVCAQCTAEADKGRIVELSDRPLHCSMCAAPNAHDASAPADSPAMISAAEEIEGKQNSWSQRISVSIVSVLTAIYASTVALFVLVCATLRCSR